MSDVYGVRPVLEALRDPHRVVRIQLAAGRGAALQRVERAAAAAGVRIDTVPRAALDRRAGPEARHQGVLAELREAAVGPIDLQALLDRLAGVEDAIVVLLDGIQDPGNLGAIIRSAHALGADGVIVPRERSAPLNAAAIKSSAGAALHLPVASVGNLKHALEPLAAQGFWIAAASMDGDPAPRVDLTGRLALVVGGEHRGVRPSLARRCDHRVAIPIRGDFDSLNASVAAGILLYEARRQRDQKS